MTSSVHDRPAVVAPDGVEEIQAILKIANQYRVPRICFVIFAATSGFANCLAIVGQSATTITRTMKMMPTRYEDRRPTRCLAVGFSDESRATISP